MMLTQDDKGLTYEAMLTPAQAAQFVAHERHAREEWAKVEDAVRLLHEANEARRVTAW